jgi:hypothetical protein
MKRYRNCNAGFDATTQSKMLAVSLYISVNGNCRPGKLRFRGPDASGTMHTFTSTAQFQAGNGACGLRNRAGIGRGDGGVNNDPVTYEG